MEEITSPAGQPVQAQRRPHPALRRLARACIALARLRRPAPVVADEQPSSASDSAPEPTTATPAKSPEAPTGPVEAEPHD